MRIPLLCCLLVPGTVLSAPSAGPDPRIEPRAGDIQSLPAAASAAELQATLNTLIAETNAVVAETGALEKILQERDQELSRLKTTARTLKAQLAPAADPAGPSPTAPAGLPEIAAQRDALVAASKNCIVFLHGREGPLGAGFFAPRGDGVEVFVPAASLSGEDAVTVKTAADGAIPVGSDLSCPDGIDLVCLHPDAEQLPRLEFATAESLPGIGAPVVVLVANPETNEITGTAGTIRGIGPDTWELDADLTPQMNGAPVLAVTTGEVIGIVTPQVAGEAADWAIGTRHEGSRSFAARTDRIGDWETIDLDRFAKEAAYIDRYNDETHIAWLAHMHVLDTYREFQSAAYLRQRADRPRPREGEDPQDYQNRMREFMDQQRNARERQRDREAELREEIEERSSEKPIARVMAWGKSYLNEINKRGGQNESKLNSREALKSRLANIYRLMEKELKADNHDISDKFTPYHARVYARARQWRQNGIDEMTARHARLSN